MKKIKFLFLSIIIFSCSPESEKDVMMNSGSVFTKQNGNWNNVLSSTDSISDLFNAMGVSRINVTSDSGLLKYRFETYKVEDDQKSFVYNNKEFIVDNDIIYESNATNYALKISGDDVYLRTPSNNSFFLISGGNFEEKLFDDPNIEALSYFARELTLGNGSKLTNGGHYIKFTSNSGGGSGSTPCPSYRIKYFSGSGGTQAAADADLAYTEAHGSFFQEPINGNGCFLLGIERGSGFFGYTSRSAWCCPGGASGGW